MSKQTKFAKPTKKVETAKETKSAKTTKSSKAIDEDAFISEDSLASGSASYMKFITGVNKFRIISKPISGWLDWVEKSPIRTTLAEGEPEAADDDNKPKKFVTFVVIDKKDNLVKILELTQQTVIKGIRALANNPDWGNPFTYDLNVEKTGQDLKTKYTVVPSPKKPLTKEQIEAAEEKPCNLELLMDGEDPWSVDEHVTEYHLEG